MKTRNTPNNTLENEGYEASFISIPKNERVGEASDFHQEIGRLGEVTDNGDHNDQNEICRSQSFICKLLPIFFSCSSILAFNSLSFLDFA